MLSLESEYHCKDIYCKYHCAARKPDLREGNFIILVIFFRNFAMQLAYQYDYTYQFLSYGVELLNIDF